MAASFPLGTTFLSQGVCHSYYHRTQAWPWQPLVSVLALSAGPSKASEDGGKERVCAGKARKRE